MKLDQSSIVEKVGYDRGVRDVDVKKSVEGVIRELVIKLELVGSEQVEWKVLHPHGRGCGACLPRHDTPDSFCQNGRATIR